MLSRSTLIGPPKKRYKNGFSPSRYTIPAHGGLFTGRYPSESGTRAKSERLSSDDAVLTGPLASQDILQVDSLLMYYCLPRTVGIEDLTNISLAGL